MTIPLPTAYLLDKHGREIMPGDTLKIEHFRGARGKIYYMHKWVEKVVLLGTGNPQPFLQISHLGLKPDHYYQQLDCRQLLRVEIVQGYGTDGTPFYDRPKYNMAPMPQPALTPCSPTVKPTRPSPAASATT